MKPSQLKLRPQQQIPRARLDQLAQYPQLQRRVNNQAFELSGVHNLIGQLKKEAMEQLKEEFINNNNNVNLHQFVWLISNSLILKNAGGRKMIIEEAYYQYELQYELVRVFEEIDIDHSNSISWEEYIEYISSSSLMEINQNNDNQFGNLKDDRKAKQLVFSHKEKALFRKNQIRKIVQIQKLGMMGIIQKKSDTLTFLNINGNPLTKPFQFNGVDLNKVLSMDYSDDDRMFGLLLSSHHVVFVEDGQMQKVHGQNKFSGDEIQIIYLRKHKLWMLVSLDNSIEVFCPAKGRNKQTDTQKTLLKFKPHSMDFLGVKQLQNPLSIVTGSRNGSLKIWSLTLNQLLVQLTPCKQDDFLNCKSIKGFEVYNNNTATFMICWMFSPEISVWLPSSSLTKPYLGKLKGHIGIVQQAKFLNDFPIVISIDSKNSIRVWDVSKMQCIQTWKMQTTSIIKIHVLKTVPYVLFYQKLIQFYKSTKENNLLIFNNQANSIENNKIKQEQEEGLKSKREKKIAKEDEQAEENKKKWSSFAKLARMKDESMEWETMTVKEKDPSQSTQIVLSVLYDNYLDCLVILMKQKVVLIAINTGKLLHSAHVENKGQSFVTMCLKHNRRLFIANNFGEIQCFKTEDFSRMYKLCPYISGSENIKQKKSKHFKPDSEMKYRSQGQNTTYETFALDYNIYNQVLIVVGECQNNSIIVTYDNFSAFQPSKKKQVTFDQKNICSFAQSQKFNLFYIGSNRPELISIWDYHNFTILRTISISNPIRSLSTEGNKYNILIVTEQTGLRFIQIVPVDAKNNNRPADANLVKGEIFIKLKRPIKKTQIIFVKNQLGKKRLKRNRVTFHDLSEDGGGQEEKKVKNQASVVQEYRPKQRWDLYMLSGSTIQVGSVESLVEQMQVCRDTAHSDRPNITKQLKNLVITPFPCPPPRLTTQLSEILRENINSSKKNVSSMRKVNDLIYFTNDSRVLHLYKPQQQKIWAKMLMPNCQIIQWRICYNLVSKIIQRLKKAQAASRQIYAYKRNERVDDKGLEYMRMCFILNKYFKPQEMQDLRDFLKGIEKKKTTIMIKEEPSDFDMKLLESNEKEIRTLKKIKQQSYFEQKYQQRYRAKSQTAQKLKQIEKKYNKAFSFIRSRQNSLGTGEKGDSNTITPSKSTSLKKTLADKQPKRSASAFKIRSTVSSISKMYIEHSKQIKNCLAKIGILNSKTKQLKL